MSFDAIARLVNTNIRYFFTLCKNNFIIIIIIIAFRITIRTYLCTISLIISKVITLIIWLINNLTILKPYNMYILGTFYIKNEVCE